MRFISVQEADFDIAAEYEALREDNRRDGAVVFFTGLVREMNQGSAVSGLTLEHYPGMTEKALQQIVDQAFERWPLNRVRLIHRVGTLDISDQIVFVGVSSSHREAAFEACHFIMDFLKTRAPFWKKEVTGNGERWVEALQKDTRALDKWET
ncbi:MAG: molybdopterin synthase catalytic subunit MoaE [Oceanospirillaceae bacterium]|uniref:molybdopterin synthase catalytic subunit MoaE n=1 Tax=unclassified Thalassolituus TaxID=2624967 RepID=UPI000C3B4F69|nr:MULTISPECIES: molybdopterin synthase catalytic subunit MoaE [unclassified Thalassolituus]MAS25841.1 molybdopterin synthase catalytic subunit MoaE [Oceanospirillaceae bacterium]MAY00133.1 molybdopterin synthase catalytic subunit MoaE [Oceanospirillaceae bacterium]MBL35738.1 molybdopterin synthase catalytic subunit MoaE [Oceanospirillaceae bacterium]MBS51520.1 molybdopterin synthase catalytic subunit MoaE [Oceanospirillaceae bacterium]|tara:strand:+ start:267 stop:722 length:456 start_codon:yes stop_codon:yes gene_type:complete